VGLDLRGGSGLKLHCKRFKEKSYLKRERKKGKEEQRGGQRDSLWSLSKQEEKLFRSRGGGKGKSGKLSL